MPSGRGISFLGGAVFLIVVGALLNISQLFAMAATLVAVVALSLIMAKRFGKTIQISVTTPEFVPAKTAFTIDLDIRGAGLVADMKLTPTLRLPVGLNLVDMQPCTASQFSQSWTASAEAVKRGVYNLKDVEILVQDPIGLANAKVTVSEPHELVVWPLPVDPYAQISRAARESAAGQEMVSKKALDGSNIYGVRPWAPGDTARRVHWPSTARLGSLAVLEFEMEQTRDILVFLDTRKLPDENLNAFETACGVASFVLQQAWNSGLKGDIAGVEGPRALHHPNANLLPRWQALTGLALAQPNSEIPIAASIEKALSRNPSPGSLVVITAHPGAEMLADISSFAARAGSIRILAVTSEANSLDRSVNIGGTSIVYISDESSSNR